MECAFKLYASPVIGGLPVSAVDVALVMKILEPIWPRIPETASRLRGRIELILDWAKVRGYRDGENPARWRGHLDKLLPRRSKLQAIRHHAALDYAELPAFVAELRARTDISARALEFLILTAARSAEVRGSTFGEIDFAAKVWTVPKERMKARREHRVPLSPRALAIISALASEAQKLATDTGKVMIFPGLLPGQPLSDMALLLAVRRLRPNATVHGMRAGFKTWSSERSNFQREVVEAALAHLNGDKVEAAYQRGDLFEKRRRLMATWSSFVGTAPRTSAEVTPIKGRGS
jgi:integrase